MTLRVGIDLGGTKIEAVMLDEAGVERLRRRVATPQGDYRATLQAVADLVHDLEAQAGGRGQVGIGTPGALSRVSGRLKNANSVCLNGQPLQSDLEALLGREVRMANDANCFALSEAVDGAGAGADGVFGVIVGTGTGAGVVVHQRVLTGPNAIAGEWGHNPLPWAEEVERPGLPCYCGKHGCIETFLSGPGMAMHHQRASGQALAPEHIVAMAEAGDATCEQTLRRYERQMARALAHVINILDPDVIVLGGGLSKIQRLYTQVPRLWGEWVFSDEVRTALRPPRHGDSSGVRGAAWLWPPA